MSEELTLEKMKIDERLKTVEDHMRSGDENRQLLMKGFDELKTTVKGMETTLFGFQGQPGLVQKIDSFLKIAEGIKNILMKIFVSICSAMVFAALPQIFKYLGEIAAKHVGG